MEKRSGKIRNVRRYKAVIIKNEKNKRTNKIEP